MAISTTDRQTRLRQIALIDNLVDVLYAMVPITVNQFKLAAIIGDSVQVDKHHTELLRIQSEMMDHIYAGIVLRKELGLI